MVTGSELGGSRVPQNLGSAQKECPDRSFLGLGRDLPDPREMTGRTQAIRKHGPPSRSDATSPLSGRVGGRHPPGRIRLECLVGASLHKTLSILEKPLRPTHLERGRAIFLPSYPFSGCSLYLVGDVLAYGELYGGSLDTEGLLETLDDLRIALNTRGLKRAPNLPTEATNVVWHRRRNGTS
jgi:hypothetical protein